MRYLQHAFAPPSTLCAMGSIDCHPWRALLSRVVGRDRSRKWQTDSVHNTNCPVRTSRRRPTPPVFRVTAPDLHAVPRATHGSNGVRECPSLVHFRIRKGRDSRQGAKCGRGVLGTHPMPPCENPSTQVAKQRHTSVLKNVQVTGPGYK